MKTIVLTGGGTAGHVTPNLALLPVLQEKGFNVCYIGSKNGMEVDLVKEKNIPYYGISTGKFRRYFDMKNFSDPFRIVKGMFEAKSLMKKLKPDIVFSKGGYVSYPVVKAAHGKKIPVILHESDMSMGLANKMSISSADKVCCCFPETLASLPKEKGVLTGTPIREELFTGDKKKAFEFCGFIEEKPVILIMGGSLGAANVNKFVDNILDELLKDFNVIHLCGKGKFNEKRIGTDGYIQFEYVGKELKDIFAATDIAISRAGANAISELLALQIPTLLIPLSKNSSRGDQILNARSYEKSGFSMVIEEEEITNEVLLEKIRSLYENREKYKKNMQEYMKSSAIDKIIKLIEELA